MQNCWEADVTKSYTFPHETQNNIYKLPKRRDLNMQLLCSVNVELVNTKLVMNGFIMSI